MPGEPPRGGSSRPQDVGTAPIRQLTISEYNNTVRDLLGTKLRPANAFETSEAAGFDTVATAGIINPRKVAAYFDAANALVDDVFADSALRGRIVTCEPGRAGDTGCADSIIKTFGLRAFRRPLNPAEVTELAGKYQATLASTGDHGEAVKQIVRIVLMAPQFLYRMEFDPDPTSLAAHPLSGYEVASRLSYTLWSSMPDDRLLTAAGSNELLTAEGVQAQVDRMLTDPKSSALLDDFAGQWLGTRRLANHVVDERAYPVWNSQLQASMQQEMKRYFNEFLHGNLTYDRFLTADLNFVDAPLASLYGMPAPTGSEMAKVENRSDHRVGFLGLAGLLTLTSRPDRSAPSIRGQLVLDALRCLHLELPANVTPTPLADPTPGQSVRQQVEAHGNMPACSPCHLLLDPVGLSLERFDAIGRYRPTYADGSMIDTTGVFPGGQPFDGLEGLAATIAKEPDVVSCAAEKLFTFSIGRPLDGASAALVSQIVDGWKGRGLTLRNLFKQFVSSDAFRFRRGQP